MLSLKALIASSYAGPLATVMALGGMSVFAAQFSGNLSSGGAADADLLPPPAYHIQLENEPHPLSGCNYTHVYVNGEHQKSMMVDLACDQPTN
ncbi:MAG: hypothetical protein AAFQ73_07010 [Pseudomonadota bacterium]